MAKWNCYNKRGEWLGVIEGDTEEEAMKNAADQDYLAVDHVEERPEVSEMHEHGKS